MLKDEPTQVYNLADDLRGQHDRPLEYLERVKVMERAWKT